MRPALMSAFVVALAAACGGVASPAEQDTSCAGDPTKPVTTEMLKRVLAGRDITVRAHYDGVICGGAIGSREEEMPVELSNDQDEAAMEREGTVFCGLRRGPIWGRKLEQDLDAPASSPIFSGEKATFSVANVECTVYPDGDESGRQVRN
ncbi:MAG: hypothetical protein ACRDPU_09425, partial [Thermoleophilia bacterium]